MNTGLTVVFIIIGWRVSCILKTQSFFLIYCIFKFQKYNYHFMPWSFGEDKADSALLLFNFVGNFGARDHKNFP